MSGKKDKDYADAARWAEEDMVLPRNSTTSRRGADAAEAGRALLARAHAGRPGLGPQVEPGTE